MLPAVINHVIYNTGRAEQISVKDLRLSLYNKMGLQGIIHQAMSPEGVEIDKNIILKIYRETYRYAATFAYGTYANNEIFLISTGAKTIDEANRLWNRLRFVAGPKYRVGTPLKRKPAGSSLVLDIMLPCSRPEALAYLHSSGCYDFCMDLGRAMLYPECAI